MKRGRVEMYYDVMRTISEGVHLGTRIMYKANLSWNPLRQILNGLMSQGLIVDVPPKTRHPYEISQKGRKRHFYDLTEKGREVLHSLQDIMEWKRRIEKT